METEKIIRAVIGLGNPGPKYYYHRHTIGFRVLDEIALSQGVSWQIKDCFEYADVVLAGKNVILVKPQTYMNDSGKVVSFLQKKGIEPSQTIVVHDEMEKKFGSVQIRLGGSHRGHNGLRSIIGKWGSDFWRLRCGIGRPANKSDVSDYVLRNFSELEDDVLGLIDSAISELDAFLES